MDVKPYERVLVLVRQLVKPPIDAEDLTMAIIAESWINGCESPSYEFIRNRCYDRMRKLRTERKFLEGYASTRGTEAPSEETLEQNMNEVNNLVKVLDNLERKVIFYRFYMDLSLNDIADRLSLSRNRIREILANAVYKMRSEAYNDGSR